MIACHSVVNWVRGRGGNERRSETMYLVDDGRRVMGHFPTSQSEAKGLETDGERTHRETLAARIDRLAELQDEQHQIEHLQGSPTGAIDPFGVSSVTSSGAARQRLLEIEAEVEHLREELLTPEPVELSPHPRAAEAVGRRILRQLGEE
jgi:hypothetical protein